MRSLTTVLCGRGAGAEMKCCPVLQRSGWTIFEQDRYRERTHFRPVRCGGFDGDTERVEVPAFPSACPASEMKCTSNEPCSPAPCTIARVLITSVVAWACSSRHGRLYRFGSETSTLHSMVCVEPYNRRRIELASVGLDKRVVKFGRASLSIGDQEYFSRKGRGCSTGPYAFTFAVRPGASRASVVRPKTYMTSNGDVTPREWLLSGVARNSQSHSFLGCAVRKLGTLDQVLTHSMA